MNGTKGNRLAGRRRSGVLGVIAFGWAITLGMRFVVPAIVPQIKEAFAVDNTTAGVAITVIWASYAVMQFPAGVLVDRLDERTLLGTSLFLAAGSLAAIGLSPAFAVFLGACGLFGLGTGLFGTARGIALSNFFSPNPGSAFGLTLAAGSVGSAAFPFLASHLIGDVGWRVVVGSSVPLFLATAVISWRAIPGRAKQGGAEGSERSLSGVWETVAAALTDRTILAAVAGLTLMLFTFQALTAFLPTYLVEERALSQGTAGALFALLFVVGAGFQYVGGRAADRLGTRRVLLAVASVGALALAALPATHGAVPLALLCAVMASRLAVGPVANAFVIDALPDESPGSAWGLLRTIFFLLSAAGSVVVGWFADHGLFDEAFFLLAGLTVAATASFWFLPAGEA